jgi:lipoic acid synthetase
MPEVYYGRVNVKIKPDWLKTKIQFNHQGGEHGHEKTGTGTGAGMSAYAEVASIVGRHGVHTICESGRCPNRVDCWSRRTATFMVLGDVCTRACKFCATNTGKPLPPNENEPRDVARSIALLGLKHAVLTSVTRDDLKDGGAKHWAEVVRTVRAECPGVKIEVLVPDFGGVEALMDVVLEAGPDVVAHNLETVERLTPTVRSGAAYGRSIEVLKHVSSACFVSKSGLMVGLGETPGEILTAMDDLRGAGVGVLTVGQYLRPTMRHIPVEEYVVPEMFEFYKREALARGFKHVMAGPLVRSSYMADMAAV